MRDAHSIRSWLLRLITRRPRQPSAILNVKASISLHSRQTRASLHLDRQAVSRLKLLSVGQAFIARKISDYDRKFRACTREPFSSTAYT